MDFQRWTPRFFAGAIGFCLLAAGLPVSGHAEDAYPSRRFELTIPYGAGSATDGVARIIADGLSRRTGQSVVVINKPGGNGMIAIQSVRNLPADGYALLMLASGVVNEQVMKKSTFDVRTDVVPVVRAVQAPLGMFVSASSPINSVAEFIAAAKKDPGKMRYATGGIGSTVHLVTERFKLATGIDMVHVPYPGGTGPISVALLRGDVDLFINELGSMRGLVDGGKVKILAVLGDKRSPVFPNAPSVPELGIAELKDVFTPFFFGFFVASGTPADRVEKLATEINATLETADVRKSLVDLGYDPALIGGTRPDEFRKVVNEELVRVETVVRDAKIPAVQ